jgi:hypothetical protein
LLAKSQGLLIHGFSQYQNEMSVFNACNSSQMRMLGQSRGGIIDGLRRFLLTIEWQSPPKPHHRPNYDLPITHSYYYHCHYHDYNYMVLACSNTIATSAVLDYHCYCY